MGNPIEHQRASACSEVRYSAHGDAPGGVHGPRGGEIEVSEHVGLRDHDVVDVVYCEIVDGITGKHREVVACVGQRDIVAARHHGHLIREYQRTGIGHVTACSQCECTVHR